MRRQVECQFCKSLISRQEVKRHESKCFLNLENKSKIYNYFLNSLDDISLLNKDLLYQFTKNNNILNVISISQRLLKKYNLDTVEKQKNWNYILILLMLELYNNSGDLNIDLEYLDMLIYKLTWGSMGL